MEFPNTTIKGRLASDSVHFDYFLSSEHPDLHIYDDSIQKPDWFTTQISVNVYIYRLNHPEKFILPDMNFISKEWIFRRIESEDELYINGNRYELVCIDNGDSYEWYID